MCTIKSKHINLKVCKFGSSKIPSHIKTKQNKTNAITENSNDKHKITNRKFRKDNMMLQSRKFLFNL